MQSGRIKKKVYPYKRFMYERGVQGGSGCHHPEFLVENYDGTTENLYDSG